MNSVTKSQGNAIVSSPPALLPGPAAQAYLGGISRSTLQSLTQRGIVRSILIGRRRLYSRTALDEYIEALEQRAE